MSYTYIPIGTSIINKIPPNNIIEFKDCVFNDILIIFYILSNEPNQHNIQIFHLSSPIDGGELSGLMNYNNYGYYKFDRTITIKFINCKIKYLIMCFGSSKFMKLHDIVEGEFVIMNNNVDTFDKFSKILECSNYVIDHYKQHEVIFDLSRMVLKCICICNSKFSLIIPNSYVNTRKYNNINIFINNDVIYDNLNISAIAFTYINLNYDNIKNINILKCKIVQYEKVIIIDEFDITFVDKMDKFNIVFGNMINIKKITYGDNDVQIISDKLKELISNRSIKEGKILDIRNSIIDNINSNFILSYGVSNKHLKYGKYKDFLIDKSYSDDTIFIRKKIFNSFNISLNELNSIILRECTINNLIFSNNIDINILNIEYCYINNIFIVDHSDYVLNNSMKKHNKECMMRINDLTFNILNVKSIRMLGNKINNLNNFWINKYIKNVNIVNNTTNGLINWNINKDNINEIIYSNLFTKLYLEKMIFDILDLSNSSNIDITLCHCSINNLIHRGKISITNSLINNIEDRNAILKKNSNQKINVD